MQISEVMTSYTQPNFDQIIMIDKNILANLHQECYIFYIKILLEVLQGRKLGPSERLGRQLFNSDKEKRDPSCPNGRLSWSCRGPT